jgi:hypothetical protein
MIPPAMLQSEVSSLILVTMTPTGTASLRKIRAFLSFHNSQEMRSIKEASGFRDWVFLLALWLHHSLTEVASLQLEGCTSWRPSQSLTMRQTLIVYRHWNRRWAADVEACPPSRLCCRVCRRYVVGCVDVEVDVGDPLPKGDVYPKFRTAGTEPAMPSPPPLVFPNSNFIGFHPTSSSSLVGYGHI